MRKLLVMLALTLPVAALAETWDKVPIVDHMCQAKLKGDTAKHPTACLLKCAKSGYSIKAADGSWLKLDDAGNQKAVAALKSTKKADDVRVTVTGEKTGDTVKVASLSIPE